MNRLILPALGLCFCLLLVKPLDALNSAPVPRPAPEFEVGVWMNGEGVTLSELRGKVVLIDFFQLWCPGCKRFSIPLVTQWKQTFAADIQAGRLEVISIHTVFEGHDYQNNERLTAFLAERNIDHLVGVDLHKDGARVPETMRRFQTRGTPEIAMIDKDGVIRFQQFGGFPTDEAEAFLKLLLSE